MCKIHPFGQTSPLGQTIGLRVVWWMYFSHRKRYINEYDFSFFQNGHDSIKSGFPSGSRDVESCRADPASGISDSSGGGGCLWCFKSMRNEKILCRFYWSTRFQNLFQCSNERSWDSYGDLKPWLILPRLSFGESSSAIHRVEWFYVPRAGSGLGLYYICKPKDRTQSGLDFWLSPQARPQARANFFHICEHPDPQKT
jgi:hypothetical protein